MDKSVRADAARWPLRDAPPIVVQVIWRRHDPHPSTHAAIAMLAELYRRPGPGPAGPAAG